MKKHIITGAAVFSLFSCEEQASTSDSQSSDQKEAQEVVENEESHDTSENKVEPSTLTEIDNYREEIEGIESTPLEVKSEELREKTKQKWEKLHFYSRDGKVVRIKTYPYKQISARTEEFYIKDGSLVLAVIEDDGAGERGKEKDQIDKMYYFENGEVIAELNNDQESEYGVRKSDGEELLAEVNEYLKIYSENAE